MAVKYRAGDTAGQSIMPKPAVPHNADGLMG